MPAKELLQSAAVQEYLAVNPPGPPEVPSPATIGGPALFRPGSRRLAFAEEFII